MLRTLFKLYSAYLFLVIGCCNPAFAVSPTTKVPAQIIIGAYFTNPPFEYLSKNQKTGLEYDLINNIARRLNLKTKYIETTWEQIINNLESNQYDIIIGAITINDARKRTINFSIPFMTTTLNIVINSKKTPRIKTNNDLHNISVAVQAKTTDYDVAMKMKQNGLIKSVIVYPYNDFNVMINDLVSGKISAIMKIYPVENYYAKIHSEFRILPAIPNEPQPLGFGFNKNNPALMKAFNEEIHKMKQDGTYTRIYNKYIND